MKYRLVTVGPTCTFKKIMHGRKWVGRVCPHADGGYLGIINKTTHHANTEHEAFHHVVAMHLGYADAHELAAANRVHRDAKRMQNARHRELARRFMSGDLTERIAVIDEMLGLKK